MTSLGGHQVQTDAEMCLRLLSGEIRSIDFEASASGAIDGILLGGNSTVLASSLGGSTGIQSRPDSICPSRMSEKFRIDWSEVFGNWSRRGPFSMRKEFGAEILTLDLVLKERTWWRGFKRIQSCVYRGAPAGHRGTLSLCPIGLKIRIDTNNGRLSSPVTWVDVQ